MGGRGASSIIYMTEREYLGRLGLADISSGYSIDKYGVRITSQRAEKKFLKEVIQHENEYQRERAKAQAEYKRLVGEGKIKPKTTVQRLLEISKGLPERADVQASRSLLKKMGYDWRTGKKLKK